MKYTVKTPRKPLDSLSITIIYEEVSSVIALFVEGSNVPSTADSMYRVATV